MSDLAMKIIFQDIRTIESDAVVVGFYEDVRPLKNLAGQLDWLLCGSLSRLILEKKLHGTLGEMALLTSRGKIPAGKIFLIGLGPRSEFSYAALKNVARMTAASVIAAGDVIAAMEYFSLADDDYKTGVHTLLEGLKEGAGECNLSISLVALDKAAYNQISRQI